LILYFFTAVSGGVIESRILGGSAATPGQFPYQISLQYFNTTTNSFKHFCGGSIIDPTHIVTAAHVSIMTNTQISVGFLVVN